MRFLVVTNAPTLKENEKFVAYAPYVNEMNIWFRNVKEVGILSPTKYPELIFTVQFDFQGIRLFRLPFLTFTSFVNILYSFVFLPIIFIQFFRAFFWTDHIHLRCPGNVGLIGCFVQILFPKKPKTVKYAGNWDPQAKQPWTYRLQKWILSNTFLTRNMRVLVYGEWLGQSKNVVPFFTASFSENEKAEVSKKTFSGPFTFLFVGNLVEGKRPLEAVKLVEALNTGAIPGTAQEIRASLEIYGDGPERKRLEKYINDNNLEKTIFFKGSRPLEELKDAYKRAHFVILPSRSEGWPKAIAEGMFFGCIPIASPVSCVPWMLNFGSRGVLLEDPSQRLTANGQKLNRSGQRTEDRGQDVVKIAQLLADQKEMEIMSEEAKKWSQQYTLERFEAAIQEVLNLREEKNGTGMLSPAPFRDRAKRGKSEE